MVPREKGRRLSRLPRSTSPAHFAQARKSDSLARGTESSKPLRQPVCLTSEFRGCRRCDPKTPALPAFGEGSFDFVLSWNVIHHGTLGDVGRRLAEIWRVLKPGALYRGTMLPTRNINYGRGRARGRAVASDTFVVDTASQD
ncbi:MAG TPA: class I SAM-dependent methyltransferase [Stellaceae bacterium]